MRDLARLRRRDRGRHRRRDCRSRPRDAAVHNPSTGAWELEYVATFAVVRPMACLVPLDNFEATASCSPAALSACVDRRRGSSMGRPSAAESPGAMTAPGPLRAWATGDRLHHRHFDDGSSSIVFRQAIARYRPITAWPWIRRRWSRPTIISRGARGAHAPLARPEPSIRRVRLQRRDGLRRMEAIREAGMRFT